ncbi:MAG TPA: STAS domain-containing protein [Phycisphaerae bacterium]|nr:STAS domain-containing protein [Phycisphaerae bacterium]
MKGDLEIRVSNQAGVVVVSLIGEARADSDAEELDRVQAMHPETVIIDASELTFLASTGMRLLVHFQRAITAYGGALRIAGLRPQVERALHEARLLHLFDVRPDVGSAIR